MGHEEVVNEHAASASLAGFFAGLPGAEGLGVVPGKGVRELHVVPVLDLVVRACATTHMIMPTDARMSHHCWRTQGRAEPYLRTDSFLTIVDLHL